MQPPLAHIFPFHDVCGIRPPSPPPDPARHQSTNSTNPTGVSVVLLFCFFGIFLNSLSLFTYRANTGNQSETIGLGGFRVWGQGSNGLGFGDQTGLHGMPERVESGEILKTYPSLAASLTFVFYYIFWGLFILGNRSKVFLGLRLYSFGAIHN